MKLKNKILLLGLLLISMMLYPSYAADASLVSASAEVNTNEEFVVGLKTSGTKIAALQTLLYFDKSKVEYISGPENSNQIGNAILYTWFDEQGGKAAKENQIMAEFRFKAKEDGMTSFGMNGSFYDENAMPVQLNTQGIEISIGQVDEAEVITQEEGENNEDPKTAYLRSLRINEEGLNPDFAKDITEYYFIAGQNVNNLQITAVPENSQANVVVTGNENLKEGLNKIQIEVTSQDQSAKKKYEILVTKTGDREAANSNLENLAIEFVTLSPEFHENTTQYEVSIPTDITDLNILAIAQNPNATVQIQGGKQLEYGDNLIEITVTAPNGFTTKKYRIYAHRRTQQEELNWEREQQSQAERLSFVQQEKEAERSGEKAHQNINTSEEQTNNTIVVIVIISLIVIIVGYLIIRNICSNKNGH